MGEHTSQSACRHCGYRLPADARTMGLCPRCLLERVLELRRNVQAQLDRMGPWPEPPTPQELGAALPQLEVLELMARGGMGLVYLARQKNLDRPVALKILPLDVQNDPAAAARFLDEAHILANLNHPNIVMALEAGQVDHWMYLTMELVRGPNLRQVLQREGKLQPRLALTIALQVCQALCYAHGQQVIHRDIKPENILLDPGGGSGQGGVEQLLEQGARARLVDFGLARLSAGATADMPFTAPQQYVGTADYVAPECRRGQIAQDQADLYALGVVLYEMLSGNVPTGHFALPSHVVPVDKRVDGIVLRCLAADPADRYASAELLRRDLTRVLAPRASRWRLTAGGVLALGALAGVGLTALWHGHAAPHARFDAGGSRPATSVAAWTAAAAPRSGEPAATQPGIMVLMPGDTVQVKWGQQWFNATVLKREGRRVLIHYDGWSDSFDEWVGSDRVRW